MRRGAISLSARPATIIKPASGKAPWLGPLTRAPIRRVLRQYHGHCFRMARLTVAFGAVVKKP